DGLFDGGDPCPLDVSATDNIETDHLNCGECGHVCSADDGPNVATWACLGGVCQPTEDGCAAGFLDLESNEPGCESERVIIYVRSNGSNSNDGLSSEVECVDGHCSGPKGSVYAGINAAPENGIVDVGGGTFPATGEAKYELTTDGVTLRGAAKNGTIIETGYYDNKMKVLANGVTLESFTFRNQDTSNFHLTGIDAGTATGLTIRDVAVVGCEVYSILLDGTSDALLEDIVISDPKGNANSPTYQPRAIGIEGGATNVTLRNVQITGMGVGWGPDAVGLQVVDSTNITIEDLVVEDFVASHQDDGAWRATGVSVSSVFGLTMKRVEVNGVRALKHGLLDGADATGVKLASCSNC
ncbi:MAG: right-handed parallel beta-helix repeat-containing protein, partial [Myxococcota bacterium]|nr:right-handed parallel beta-helix repeat-containing protein [Myxococcota bacterium]